MSRLLRSLLGVVVFFFIVAALPAALLAFLLLTRAETLSGHVFGAAVLVGLPVFPLLWFSLYLKNRASLVRRGSLGLVVAVVVCLSLDYGLAPSGSGADKAEALSIFTGTAAYKRVSPANLVPEIDQLKLGSFIFPGVDPFIDREQGVRVRRLFLSVYREMRQSPEFEELGSMMHDVYLDTFLGERPTGHLYMYVPKREGSDEPLPVILFLHGSLGNFKGYLWVWKKFADTHGYAIVAPSFGMGNWNRPGGVEAVERARQYCIEHPRMDGQKITLAGLSNGGKGVSRAASASPDAYLGLLFISPVMENGILMQSRFLGGWRGRRVLVLHGAKDRRIPQRHVEGSVAALRRGGVVVQTRYYANEDHFLMFSSQEELLADIAAWMGE